MFRILVIDDAATVRMYHRKIFTDAGWSTEEAINGLEALERVRSQAAASLFDLFVVDINMPKMDGYAFVHELRKDASLPQVPVLMVSTEAQGVDRQKALQAGANCYLVKPTKPQALVLAAALLLGDATAARSAAQGMGV